jgi:hypothetical protein
MRRCVRNALLLVLALATACPAADATAAEAGQFVQQYCLDCHSGDERKGGLSLDGLLSKGWDANPVAWEKVVRKLTGRQMPPPDATRPTEREYVTAIAELESELDAAAAKSPNPGRTETFRRLNRTEYRNAIRDLLSLEVDAASLLPADQTSHGFDNVTVTDLSPTHLNRYIAAAEKISQLAVGSAPSEPRGETFRVRPDVTQDTHLPGLPLGTRGGILIPYNFPVEGTYEVQVHLMRDRNEGIEGLSEPHEMEFLLDRERVGLLTVKPPGKGETEQSVDANLKVRVQTSAGPHQLGVAFLRKSASLLETTRQPLNVHFNYYRHPRIGPAVYEVSIVGPFDAGGQVTVEREGAVERQVTVERQGDSREPSDTPSRRRVFIRRPAKAEDEEACAKQILANLARRAYRRPVTDDDLAPLLAFYRQGREDGDFETGIQAALAAILVNPQFLFRIERDPPNIASSTPYTISDLELASRLSFFLWSSIPDDELLDLAERGKLRQPEVLERQVRRMLADNRSRSLVTNFTRQWLHLGNLDSISPDMRLYPDFDDNLRQAMRRETEFHVQSVIRDDRSVLELVTAAHTYLNERLARHYGIPHIHGSRFRRVNVDASSNRGGLLRQASLLTVTSYATRTSPVIRGHYVLQNLVGSPPPPPPPDVPALADNTVLQTLSIRERLSQHRANAACASCHVQMDPVGFSLENFDAIGRWRTSELGQPIDATGDLLDGREFRGVAGLEQALLDRPELFVRTLTEKLLTFALGRGSDEHDAPAIRQIVREAKADDFRFSRIVLGIVQSPPFQMRISP